MERRSDGHGDFEEMAVAHVLGGLDQSQGQLFRSHLLECHDCRARVGELQDLAHELDDVERDERRARAVNALDTKRADEAEDEESGQAETPDKGERRGRRRWARPAAIAAAVAIVLLSVWNFTLRGEVQRATENAETLQDGAAVAALGEAGRVTASRGGVEGQVRVRSRRMTLVVDGLEDARYGVYVVGEDGSTVPTVRPAAKQATEGQLLLYRPEELPDSAEAVVVTEGSRPLPPEPEGELVLEASLPELD
jgi:hypothetical protein